MYTLEVTNLAEIRSKLAQFPEKSAPHLNEAIRKTLIAIQREAMVRAPVDTGKMRSSWRVSLGRLTGSLVNSSSYAVFMETGSRPHFPPIKAITPWANRHGIPPFAVARSIARKGIKPKHFFKGAISTSERMAQHFFDDALKKIVQSIW